mmetsp:Transcript_104320/g.300667  ORF Transcript_104320/g.300667 Transcript_104320/m.300667 type:complete len:252 (+) Transcript_104320:346-1101(+)
MTAPMRVSEWRPMSRRPRPPEWTPGGTGGREGTRWYAEGVLGSALCPELGGPPHGPPTMGFLPEDGGETRDAAGRRRAEEAARYVAVMSRWGADIRARRAQQAAFGLRDGTRVDEVADMGGGDGRLGAEFRALAGQLAGRDTPEAGWCAVLLALSGAGMAQVSDVVQMWPLADAVLRSIGLEYGSRVDVRAAVERIMVERTDGHEFKRRWRAERRAQGKVLPEGYECELWDEWKHGALWEEVRASGSADDF